MNDVCWKCLAALICAVLVSWFMTWVLCAMAAQEERRMDEALRNLPGEPDGEEKRAVRTQTG